LPVTFYKNDDDLPAFEDYSMSNRTYRYFKGEALYPFGFGLSYTTFQYANLKLSKASVKKGEATQAEVTVTNTGKNGGDEVVQLYITHEGFDFAPLSALKNFRRITLAPGASQKISFNLTADLLSLVDRNGNTVFNPGKVKIIVGGCSPTKKGDSLGMSKAAETALTLK
jgi:Glycosyl hydrolase family 3 C terminal domain.